MSEEVVKRALKALHQRPIAYYPVYAKIMGSVSGGVLLSQVLYCEDAFNGRPFWKVDRELRKETGVTDRELREFKRTLKTKSFVKVSLSGLPARTWYDFNAELLFQCIAEASTTPTGSDDGEHASLYDGVLTSPTDGVPTSETSSETYSKTSSSSPTSPPPRVATGAEDDEDGSFHSQEKAEERQPPPPPKEFPLTPPLHCSDEVAQLWREASEAFPRAAVRITKWLKRKLEEEVPPPVLVHAFVKLLRNPVKVSAESYLDAVFTKEREKYGKDRREQEQKQWKAQSEREIRKRLDKQEEQEYQEILAKMKEGGNNRRAEELDRLMCAYTGETRGK